MHETLLKVLDDRLRTLISHGKTVVGYFPVHFEARNSEGSAHAVSVSKNVSCIKFHDMKTLFDCNELFVEPLAKVAVSGLLYTTASDYKMPLHLLVSWYVADIPETEAFLSLKLSSQTIMPFHFCCANKKKLNSCTNSGKKIASYKNHSEKNFRTRKGKGMPNLH